MTEFDKADHNGDGSIDRAEWERMKLDAERERLAGERGLDETVALRHRPQEHRTPRDTAISTMSLTMSRRVAH